MRRKNKGVVVLSRRRALGLAAVVLLALGLSVSFAATRAVQLGELRARVTLLETVMRQPITDEDIQKLEARLAALEKPSAKVPAFLESLATLEAKLPFPVIFDQAQLRILGRNAQVAAVGKLSGLRRSGDHLFWSLNDIRVVFFNAPPEAEKALADADWAALVGRSGEWQGQPQIVVTSALDVIPAR